ncbi:MAG TPA: STAS domain-containing protein [Tepidisphaeraceae bacterium]|jgi:anti-anti-sigma factor|nr:STAS domain-containing protein [Tepidisphaeraceae bacterium]
MDMRVARVKVESIESGFKTVFKGSIHTDIEGLDRELKRVVIAKPRHVEIDLAEVATISSMGLGLLVSFRNGIVGSGGTVKIVKVQKFMHSMFRFARLEEMFQIDSSAILTTPTGAGARKSGRA